MSGYYFNGQYYSTAEARDRAQSAYYEKEARNKAEELRLVNNRLAGEISQLYRHMEAAHGDVRRLEQSNQAIQQRVREMHSNQERLENLQQEMKSRMERDFKEVRDSIRCTQESVHDLERAHQEHVRLVEEAFSHVQQEMIKGFNEAEKRRKETEQRLRKAIQDVDRKVEDDRKNRLAQQKNERDRAQTQIELVEGMLEQHQGQAEPLHLHAEIQSVRGQLSQAKALLANGDSSASLATSAVAFGQAAALEHEVCRRAVELEQTKDRILEDAAAIRGELSDEKLQQFFQAEAALTEEILNKVCQEAGCGYVRYDRLSATALGHEKVMRRVRNEVLNMKAMSPILKDRDQERIEEGKKILASVVSVFGAKPQLSLGHLDSNDPKSPRQILCDFGKSKVEIVLGIDGKYQVQSWGNDTDTCQSHMKSLTQALNTQSTVTKSEVDHVRADRPPVQHQQFDQNHAQVAGNLRKIGDQL